MNFPAWHMKPIHILLKLIGTKKLALGSSGHSGKAALKEVIGYLKQGYNTVINPDGPSGPVKKLKHGVLEMSLATGVPVIPLKIITSKKIEFSKTWDKKRIPLPFSVLTVEYGEPVQVTAETYEEAKLRIEQQME